LIPTEERNGFAKFLKDVLRQLIVKPMLI